MAAGEAPAEVEGDSQATPAFGSAIAGIAKQHEEIRSEKSISLQVPGYEGKMKVEYRLLPEPEMDRLANRIEESTRGKVGMSVALEAEAQMLVDMCDKIYVRDPEVGDEWEVLEDNAGPVRFEARFAEILSKAGVVVRDTRAREVVLDFFSPRADKANPTSPRTQPQAVEAHTNALILWHRGQRESIAQRLLGE